jgi:hypothetical protein
MTIPRAHRIRTRGTRRRRCYELAGRGILQDDTWLLVQGRACGVDHAWLEREGWVYDGVLDQEFSKADYYTEFRALAGRTYTAKEAAHQLIMAGHWGPWHDAPPQMPGAPRRRHSDVQASRKAHDGAVVKRRVSSAATTL